MSIGKDSSTKTIHYGIDYGSNRFLVEFFCCAGGSIDTVCVCVLFVSCLSRVVRRNFWCTTLGSWVVVCVLDGSMGSLRLDQSPERCAREGVRVQERVDWVLFVVCVLASGKGTGKGRKKRGKAHQIGKFVGLENWCFL